METPIYDFLNQYQASASVRFHMPGHKGQEFLGCEGWDITEIPGADDLGQPTGIIAQSEGQASELFGSQATFYVTGGSSQSIRAMLFLLASYANLKETRLQPGQDYHPYFLAGRNAHKAFIYSLALLDGEVDWLWPDQADSICSGKITGSALEAALQAAPRKPAAVYLTSPDYLGGQANIKDLAQICHQYGTLLAVDNAHGAYLHFLDQPSHPLDLGADICCDSAHKTLPVLTGGAYLHLGKSLPPFFGDQAQTALNLFGSTSPSYLSLASLDLANRYLASDYPQDLRKCISQLDAMKVELRSQGWQVEDSEPLKLTLHAPLDLSGLHLAQILQTHKIFVEYADRDYVVLMLSPQNNPKDLDRLSLALGSLGQIQGRQDGKLDLQFLQQEPPPQVLSIRRAVFAPQESVPISQALGRICAAPTASCPPAIPLAVSGEILAAPTLQILDYYGIEQISVVRE